MNSTDIVGSVSVLAALLTLASGPARAQTAGQQIRLTGALINTNTGGTGHVDIEITRWSTRAETDRLLAVLDDQGQPGFLEALGKNRRVGFIRTPGQLAYDLRYATESPLPEGGREILLATDRPMGMAELWNRGRSIDYPFTWIQIRLNRDGEGEGTITMAAKVIPAGGRDLVVESYDWMQTVLLKSLRSEPLKK